MMGNEFLNYSNSNNFGLHKFTPNGISKQTRVKTNKKSNKTLGSSASSNLEINKSYFVGYVNKNDKKNQNSSTKDFWNTKGNILKKVDVDVISVSSEESSSNIQIKKPDTQNFVKFSEQLNGYNRVSSTEFKRRKVVVKLRKESKLNKVIYDLAMQQLYLNYKQRKNIKSINNESKLGNGDLNGNQWNYQERYCDSSIEYDNDSINLEEKIKSVKQQNLSASSLNSSNGFNNTLPHFEVIFVDTTNIEDTNSESSPLFKENFLQANNSSQLNNSNQQKNMNINSNGKKNHSVKATKKRKNKKFKTQSKFNEKRFRIKKCKVKLKNLNSQQIKRTFKEARHTAKNRRRSWSVSDVAREHDRRLNFIPQPGPSHVRTSRIKRIVNTRQRNYY